MRVGSEVSPYNPREATRRFGAGVTAQPYARAEQQRIRVQQTRNGVPFKASRQHVRQVANSCVFAQGITPKGSDMSNIKCRASQTTSIAGRIGGCSRGTPKIASVTPRLGLPGSSGPPGLFWPLWAPSDPPCLFDASNGYFQGVSLARTQQGFLVGSSVRQADFPENRATQKLSVSRP